jgi:hypothetical protein
MILAIKTGYRGMAAAHKKPIMNDLTNLQFAAKNLQLTGKNLQFERKRTLQ